jgi:chitinase
MSSNVIFGGGAMQCEWCESNLANLKFSDSHVDFETAYAHEGVSLMNGRSDAGEYFRQADFQTVLDYATQAPLATRTSGLGASISSIARGHVTSTY